MESFTFIKNNILFSMTSIFGIFLLGYINQLGYPIYQNILYFLSLAALATFISRYLFELKLFDFEIYFTVGYMFILLFLMLVIVETIVIVLLFLPAEIMYFRYFNFNEWSNYILENYIGSRAFMQFIKVSFILSSAFFISVFFMKLIGIATNKEKSLLSIIRISYQFSPLLMTMIILIDFAKEFEGLVAVLLFLLMILGNQIHKKITAK